MAAKRIYEQLQDEHGYASGIPIVTDYVRERQRRVNDLDPVFKTGNAVLRSA